MRRLKLGMPYTNSRILSGVIVFLLLSGCVASPDNRGLSDAFNGTEPPEFDQPGGPRLVDSGNITGYETPLELYVNSTKYKLQGVSTFSMNACQNTSEEFERYFNKSLRGSSVIVANVSDENLTVFYSLDHGGKSVHYLLVRNGFAFLPDEPDIQSTARNESRGAWGEQGCEFRREDHP